MKKIKVAMVTNHLDITGIGTVIMNYCMALDKDRYDLTVIAGVPIAEKYINDAKENNIKIVALPSRHTNPQKHYMALYKTLKAGKYDIIHDHGNSSMMAIELTIARFAGIKIRIAHSHNSICPNIKVHKILNPYFCSVYTKALACGQMAGDWLFGKSDFEVVPNGFHTANFAFSKANRKSIRMKLNIENQLVIGHIGRMNGQKNQEYLLKIFEKLAPMRCNAVLLLVGAGPDYQKVKAQAAAHRYRKRIILYGETDNPAALYSAMDVFVFPSRFEGLPVVLLEAQISGLPCIVSDRVTREMDFGDIVWESIDHDPKVWAEKICNMKAVSDTEREKYCLIHKEQIAGYDIENTVKQLDRIYRSLMEKE